MPPKTDTAPAMSTLDAAPDPGRPEFGLQTVDLKSLDMGEAASAPRFDFWLGTLPGSPYQNIAAGGVGFNRYEDPTRKDAAGNLARVAKLGEILKLTEKQAERVLAGIVNRVIRWSAAEGSAPSMPRLVLRDAAYQPEPGDKPFAEYVYFVRLPANLPEGWRVQCPPSVAEASRRAAASKQTPTWTAPTAAKKEDAKKSA